MKSDAAIVLSIATCASLATLLFHESIHAAACWAVSASVTDFSALHVNCRCDDAVGNRIVAGSASLANLLLAVLLWPVLRRIIGRDGRIVYFVWLFFLLNLLAGTGYWVASGVGNFGDWAAVIDGLEPHWIYRIALSILGFATFMSAVAIALREFGRIVGGTSDELFGRSQYLATLSYIAALGSVTIVGLFHPAGFVSKPVLAGIIAVAGSYSPLLWMMQWFRADMFIKHAGSPLELQWSRRWLVLALGTVALGIIITRIG